MRRDTGSVTAETAVALPALVIVLAAALWVLAAAGAKIECIDAARAAARAASRGEDPQAVRSAARRAAPEGAFVGIWRGHGRVEVTVRARVHPIGTALAEVGAVTVLGQATAAVEGR